MVGVTRGVTIAVTFGVTRAVTDVVVLAAVVLILVVVLPTAVVLILVVVLPTAVVLILVVVLPTAVVLTLVVVLPTAMFPRLVLATLPRPAMFPVFVAILAPRPAIVAVLAAVRPATFGLMRAVMVGVREPILRFGVRMMLCASAAPGEINATAAPISAAAARCVTIRRLALQPFNRASPDRHHGPDGNHCAGAARLMIFSFCSRVIRPAISCRDIGLSPNCRRNSPPAVLLMIVAWLASRNAVMSDTRASGVNLTKACGPVSCPSVRVRVSFGPDSDAVWNVPPCCFAKIAPMTPACSNSASAPSTAEYATARGDRLAKNSATRAEMLSDTDGLRAGSASIAANSFCIARADGAPRLSLSAMVSAYSS